MCHCVFICQDYCKNDTIFSVRDSTEKELGFKFISKVKVKHPNQISHLLCQLNPYLFMWHHRLSLELHPEHRFKSLKKNPPWLDFASAQFNCEWLIIQSSQTAPLSHILFPYISSVLHTIFFYLLLLIFLLCALQRKSVKPLWLWLLFSCETINL